MFHRIGRMAAIILIVGVAAACSNDTSASGPDDSSETRTIETAKGSIDVPKDPQRVVVLDTGELDNALALGVEPVGAVTTDVASGFLGYLGDQTDGIETLGTINEPNLEKIAAAEPDLILSSAIRHDSIYDQLSEIAPTVLTETVGYPWKDNLQMHGEALGKEDEADELMAEYDRKAKSVAADIDNVTTLSLVRFLEGETRLYSDESFSGVIMDDVGVDVPTIAQGVDTHVEVSQEKLGVVDADYILTSTYGARDTTDQAEITNSGLWTSLKAVQDGRTRQIDDDLISGVGVQAADGLLDELRKAFASSATGR